jgi:PST family polysaccharide transporter
VGLIAIGQSVVNGVIAVTLAFRGFGVWSLAWGPVASALFYCIVANAAARYLPRPRIDRAAFRDLFSFGTTLTLKNILVYVACHADLLVIGKFLGEASLGLYTKAFSLVSIPHRQFVKQLNRVTFPAFSRIQTDHARICSWYLTSTRFVAVSLVPCVVALGVLAPDLVISLFTEKWAGMITATKILCAAGVLNALYSLGGPIVEATGNVVYEVYLGILYALAVVIGSYLGSAYGIEGVAIAMVVASAIMFVGRLLLLRSLISLSIASYVRALLPAVSSALVALVATWVTVTLCVSADAHLIRLLLGSSSYIAVYFVGLSLWAPEDCHFVFRQGTAWISWGRQALGFQRQAVVGS